MHDGPRKHRTLLASLAAIVLLLHVIVALWVVVWPESSRGSAVLTFYRRFVVLGPFFQESRIVAANHVLISQYENGMWSAWGDLSGTASAGKYRRLQRRSFENFLTYRAASRKQRDAVKELETYLRSQTSFRSADSLAVTLVRRRATEAGVRVDTVYRHKFRR